MRVGLTFFVHKTGNSVWTNGAAQNCFFLWLLLRAAFGPENVFAINAGDGEDAADSMLAQRGVHFVRADTALLDSLDLLIEGAGQVSAGDVARVREHGGKAVTYKFGNAYVIDAERAIHNKPTGAIFNGSRFDAVWTTPQHVHTCWAYWQLTYRCPVRVLPHIWAPDFVRAAVAEFPEGLAFEPKPGPKPRVAILEPNINIVKTSHLPMLVCEAAHRLHPTTLGPIMVTNSEHLKTREAFRTFAANLDIVKDGLASFESRFNTPYFLAKYADVVVTHQWENGLNYAYYDALSGGYPLVHNSPFLPAGVGFRYHDFNAFEGADRLIDAVESLQDPAAHAAYVERAHAFLATVHPLAPAVVEAHVDNVRRLFA